MRTLLAFCFIFTTVLLTAQIQTDRPDQTESSSTVGKGELQIESGILVQHTEGIREVLIPTNLFRYGLTRNVELRVLSEYGLFKNGSFNADGITDLQIGTKIQLLKNENKNTEIAFLSHLIIPSGTNGFTIDEYGTINKLSISHSLSENIGIGYNLGYDFIQSSNGNFTYSVALGFSVNDHFGMYIEPFGSWVEFEEFDHNFDAGITYLVNDNCQLDFSFGTGISNEFNYISVGGSWLIQPNTDDDFTP
jgi:hypothetical protein